MIFGGFEKFTLIDYPGKIACMVYTIGCNFRCPYCHNPELVDEIVENTIDEKDILEFLNKRKGILDGIVITGGEPTIHNIELIDFIKRVKKLGFLVKLDSNGTNSKILKKLIDEKLVDYIAMDIKSTMQKYSRTVARPTDIKSIRKSIKLLINSNIDYEFRTTVIKSFLSLEDFKIIGEEIRNAKKYFLQKFIPKKILNAQFRNKVSYTDIEFKEIQEIMNKYVQFCGLRL